MSFKRLQDRRFRLFSGFAFILIALIASLSLLPQKLSQTAGYNWLQFGFNSQHTANNTLETTITKANVNTLTRLFQITLVSPRHPIADDTPVYLSGANTNQGVKDLLFLNTQGGDLFAMDAHTGAIVWSANHEALPPPPADCVASNGGFCFTTSSPVIDPNLNFVYVAEPDGLVHKHQIFDGTEIVTGGWPEQFTRKPLIEKGSSNLSLGPGFLYMTTASFDDTGDYQGHVTAINLATGAQNTFNTQCSNITGHLGSPGCLQGLVNRQGSGVWARAGTLYDPSLNRLFIVTGNGDFLPASPDFDWGDSVLALNPDGTGAGGGNPVDSYTPANFLNLQANDQDLGSTIPSILPVPPASTIQHLGVVVGKDGILRLINLQNLNNGTGPLGTTGGEISTLPVPQNAGFVNGIGVLTNIAVWVNPADNSTWIFVANPHGISGLRVQLTGGNVPFLQPMWTNPLGGTSPIIANGVLFYADSGLIQALDPLTGTQLWSDTTIGGIHWESPIVDNGVLYITDSNFHVTAYTLSAILTATSTATPTNTATSLVTSTSTVIPTGTLLSTPGRSPTSGPGTFVPPNAPSNAINANDPQISKVGSQAVALPGDTVSFAITVSKPGGSAIQDVIVTDPLPNLLDFVSATTTQGTFSTNGNTVTFNIGTLRPGQVVTLTVTTKVDKRAIPPEDLINTATLTWAGGTRTSSAVLRLTLGTLPATGEHPGELLPWWIVLGLGLITMGTAYRFRQRG